MRKSKDKKGEAGGKAPAGDARKDAKVEHPRTLGSNRRPSTDRALTAGRGGGYDTKG